MRPPLSTFARQGLSNGIKSLVGTPRFGRFEHDKQNEQTSFLNP
jgi:hypothetical protein